jgi:thiol reductant ABC exporter CydC subunit
VTTLRRLLRLAAAPRGRSALAVLLGAATVLCGVGLMATAGYVISRAAERPDVLALGVAIVGVRFFALARPITRYLERLASHDLALRVLGGVRARFYRRIEPLAPADLGGYRTGDLLSRLVADVDAMQNLQLRGTGPPLTALIAGLVSVAVTAAFLPAAALALGVGLLIAAVAAPAATVALGRKAASRQAPVRGVLTADLVETLAGASELAVYGRIDEHLGRLRQDDEALAATTRRAALAEGAGDGLRLLVTGATTAVVLALAIDAHAAGRLDRTLIAMLALLSIAAFEAVQPLAQAARELTETVAAGGRVLAVMDREPRIHDPAEPRPLPEWPFGVALEDVAARYEPDDRRALDGLSLRLEPGRRIALLGPSGAGKTTVANLLIRFLDPEAGRVTLGGHDLRDYRQDDLRSAIAVAGQDAHVFSATIRENVALGRRGATDAEVEGALERAGLLGWVRGLDDGLDTLVGEQGRALSGGQRQRIALARALLTAAPVLVLDEPTAHLDPAGAEALVDDVLAAAPDATVLLITHRPEGLGRMDEIVTLAG